MRPRLLLIAVAVAMLGFAPAPFPKPRSPKGADDLSKMQGTWVAIKYEYNGRETLTQQEMLVVFEGLRTTCTVGDRVFEWTFVLSAACFPRAITSTEVNGRMVLKGIYRFEGDTLIICEDVGGAGVRPTEFDSKGNHTLLVLKRR